MNFDSAFLLWLLLPLVAGWMLAAFVRRARRSAARWPRVVLGNLLLLAFLLSLLFLGGEIYYRFLYDKTDSLSYTKTSQAWFRRNYIRNGAGVRDNIEYPLARESAKPRITFVGDSFTVGHGIKNVDDRFVNRLRAAHPEWEVHLLGELGYDTSHELGMLTNITAKHYELDQVVLVYVLNDISDIIPEWQGPHRRIFAEATQRGWLRENSYFADTLYHRFQLAHNPFMKNYYGFVRDAYDGPLWETQKQRLTQLRDLVQARGGRLLVVTFPFLQNLGPHYEYGPVHAKLDRFWMELNVPHVDLLSVYQDLPPEKITVNRYDAHPNEYAHRLAAERIDEFLKHEIPAAGAKHP